MIAQRLRALFPALLLLLNACEGTFGQGASSGGGASTGGGGAGGTASGGGMASGGGSATGGGTGSGGGNATGGGTGSGGGSATGGGMASGGGSATGGGTASGGGSATGGGTGSGGGSATGGGPATPTGYFTDLVKAPLDAWVTAWGRFAASAGVVTLGGTPQAVHSWSSSKVVFVVSGSGGALLIDGQAVGSVEVIAGRVREVTPSTIVAAAQSWLPGDTFYLHQGTYTGIIRSEGWNNESHFDLRTGGTAAQPIAVIGYPGEVATMASASGQERPVFALGDSDQVASHLVIANLNMVTPTTCVWGGGYTADSSKPEAGAVDVRVIGNRCEITDTTSNTMTGMIALQGDGWKVLGNTFVNDPSRVIINNNHAIYIQSGADEVEVAYNSLVDLRVGHVIQIHQDGTPMRYENAFIHHNLLQGRSAMDMRGIVVGNASDDSTVRIEHNTLRNLGQQFSGICVYRGVVSVVDNESYDIQAPVIDINGQAGGSRQVTITGNRFGPQAGNPAVAIDNGATWSDVTLSGNAYCGVTAPSQETDARPCPM